MNEKYFFIMEKFENEKKIVRIFFRAKKFLVRIFRIPLKIFDFQKIIFFKRIRKILPEKFYEPKFFENQKK